MKDEYLRQMRGATDTTIQFIRTRTNPLIQPRQLLELSCLINKTDIMFSHLYENRWMIPRKQLQELHYKSY